MVQEKQLAGMEKQFEIQKKKLLATELFWKGSITKRWMTCGNPGCKCKTDRKQRHGPYYWWTTKKKGCTQAVLIPKQSLDEAKKYLKNYKEFYLRIQALSQLSEEIIRKKLKSAKNELKRKP